MNFEQLSTSKNTNEAESEKLSFDNEFYRFDQIIEQRMLNKIEKQAAKTESERFDEENEDNWYDDEYDDEESYEQREKMYQEYLNTLEQEKIRSREYFFNTVKKHEQIVKKLLEKYNVDIDIQKIGNKLFKIPISQSEMFLDQLPIGYAYRGGAARAILHRKTRIDNFATPRDIDLAYIGKTELENTHLSNFLAQKFSPEDFENGYGVDTINDDYFDKQDFTINEILATQSAIYLTIDCLLDNVRGILRVSEYEKRYSYTSNPYYVKDKLLAKALRFISDKDMSFWNDEVFEWQGIQAFHIALHLDRALGTSYETARKYVAELQSRQLIPANIETPEQLIQYLRKNTDFIFRHVNRTDIEQEDEFIKTYSHLLSEKELDDYQSMPKRSSFSKP